MYVIKLKKSDRTISLRKVKQSITLQQVGRRGPQGEPGQGVPTGGAPGQVLTKDSSTDFDTSWQNAAAGGVSSVNGMTGDVVLDKSDIGLGSVDNTSDLNKPISTATQTALNEKANDNEVVKLTGDQSIAGQKTFTDNLTTNNVSVNGNAAINSGNLLVDNGNVTIQNGNLNVDGNVGINGTVDLNNSSIINLADPLSNQDAATKKYVDDNAGGGGQVDSVVAGTGIDVNSADPTAPEVSLNSSTQTSLGLANTAVQPAALNAKVNKSGDTMTGNLTVNAGITSNSVTVQNPTDTGVLNIDWSSNVIRLFTTFARVMHIGDGGGYLIFDPPSASGAPKFSYNRLSGTSGSLFRVTGSALTGASGTASARQYGLKIDPTLNQSGAGQSSMLMIDPTVTALGSGTHYLADLRVGGVLKATVDHNGNIEIHEIGGGVIMRTPDGSRWKLTMANGGILTTTEL